MIEFKDVISLLTSIVTLFGVFLTGRKIWWGWLVSLGSQGLWFVFIFSYGAWGLLPLAVALTVIFAVNAVRWYRDENA